MDFRSLMPFGSSRITVPSGSSDPFQAMRREMDRMLDSFQQGSFFGGLPAAFSGTGYLTPKVDVAETEQGLEVFAELPGIDEKDIAVNLEQGVLTIEAEHKSETEKTDEKKHYHLVERSYGTFLRRVAVPFEPDADKIEATFDKGVLKIKVPRSAAATRNVRKIEVKAH